MLKSRVHLRHTRRFAASENAFAPASASAGAAGSRESGSMMLFACPPSLSPPLLATCALASASTCLSLSASSRFATSMSLPWPASLDCAPVLVTCPSPWLNSLTGPLPGMFAALLLELARRDAEGAASALGSPDARCRFSPAAAEPLLPPSRPLNAEVTSRWRPGGGPGTWLLCPTSQATLSSATSSSSSSSCRLSSKRITSRHVGMTRSPRQQHINKPAGHTAPRWEDPRYSLVTHLANIGQTGAEADYKEAQQQAAIGYTAATARHPAPVHWMDLIDVDEEIIFFYRAQ